MDVWDGRVEILDMNRTKVGPDKRLAYEITMKRTVTIGIPSDPKAHDEDTWVMSSEARYLRSVLDRVFSKKDWDAIEDDDELWMARLVGAIYCYEGLVRPGGKRP